MLSLKLCPNVAFAGVDSPEDITVHTYQELFHTGGFVVSDDKVLETVTPGESRCHPLAVDVQGQFPARFLTSTSKNFPWVSSLPALMGFFNSSLSGWWVQNI